MPMHWSFGLIVVIILAAAGGAWYAKSYPGTIPFVT